MKKEIHSEILIQADAASIWKTLTDFEAYPKWNPFIKFIKGDVYVGNRITVRMEAPGTKGMNFKPKVLVFDKNKSFRWLGHLIIPGLFDGEHIFEIIENPDGTCLFVQREKFNGILLPLFVKMLDENTLEGFRAMNLALKNKAESLWKNSRSLSVSSSD